MRVCGGVWSQFVCLGCVCVGGWLVNFVPFLLMEKTLFLYHYLPALCYLYLLSPALLEHAHTHLLRYTRVINQLNTKVASRQVEESSSDL